MSVITDFVIANVNEAPAVAAENKPVGKWYGIEYKSIDNIKLMTLYSILKKTPYKDEWSKEYVQVAGDATNGPIVLVLPNNLISELEQLKDFEAVAKEWAASEEFVLDGWKYPEVLILLKDLVKLSHQAKVENKPVLLWISW